MRVILIRSLEVGRPALKEGGAILWAGILNCIGRKKLAQDKQPCYLLPGCFKLLPLWLTDQHGLYLQTVTPNRSFLP